MSIKKTVKAKAMIDDFLLHPDHLPFLYFPILAKVISCSVGAPKLLPLPPIHGPSSSVFWGYAG